MIHTKILVVDDNSIDKTLIEERLKEDTQNKFDLAHSFSMKETFSMLAKINFDVVLLDLGLPDSIGYDTFAKFHASFPDMPVIVISGYEDSDMAQKLMDNGAHGYLIKGKYNSESLWETIKLAISKQAFRNKVQGNLIKQVRPPENQIFTNPSPKPKNIKEQIQSKLDPDLAKDLIIEYSKLIPLSQNVTKAEIELSVQSFFQVNAGVFTMLNIQAKDIEYIHQKAMENLTFVDKSNKVFLELTNYLLQNCLKQYELKSSSKLN
jgi:DNA-binding NarL/FixJ family response regulator